MSGGSLPKTGTGAVTLGGGILGAEGSVSMPLPVAIALMGVGMVLLGTLFVRVAWRRGRTAGQ